MRKSRNSLPSFWKTFPTLHFFFDRYFSTLLSFLSFVLWINFHSSFCVVSLYPLFLVLFCSTSPQKKKKFDTFYYTPLIFVEVIFLLVWCSLLLFFYPVVLVLFCPTSQKRKKKKKEKKKSDVFLACHRCSHSL